MDLKAKLPLNLNPKDWFPQEIMRSNWDPDIVFNAVCCGIQACKMALLGAKEFIAIGNLNNETWVVANENLVCNIFNEHYKWPVYIISMARADHGRKWPHDSGRLQRRRR
jgi:hypothetical protein